MKNTGGGKGQRVGRERGGKRGRKGERAERGLPHPIIPRPRTRPHHNRHLRHLRPRNRHNQLRAMFRDPAPLRALPNHKPADILQKHQGYAALATQLDKMRALERRFAEEDAVICEDADGLVLDMGETGYEGGSVEGFELAEEGAVGQARDEFVGGEGGAQGGAVETWEVGEGVEGFFPLFAALPFTTPGMPLLCFWPV